MGTYHGVLEGLEDLGVDRDLVVARCDGRHVNCNVSVGLCERVVDLVCELQDVVLDLALRLERWQVHRLYDRL